MSDQTTRRRKPAERQAALSMRIAPATRDELVERATASGRSVTQEADRLLQQALLVEKLMGRTGLRPMIEILTAFTSAGERHAADLGISSDWTEVPECYLEAAMAALMQLLEDSPGPWDGELWHTNLDHVLRRAENRRTGRSGFIAPKKKEPQQ